MAKIAVINSSAPTYNLAAHKMLVEFKRQGHEVFFSPHADMWSLQCQKAYFSVIFTWHLPTLCLEVNMLKSAGVEVEIGGPAATAMPEYIVEHTGVKPFLGIKESLEHVRGPFKATFTSRGCPRACEYCIVSKLEGTRMKEYSDFAIPTGRNPYVCDNNILLTTWNHQRLVVDKLRGVRNLDINSGFDDRVFIRDPEKYWQLYNELDLEAWRFAYDKPEQKDAIKACADFLHTKGVDYRHILVYCIIGTNGDTFQLAQQRLQYLIDIGVSPYPQRYRPLDTLVNAHDPGWKEGTPENLFLYYGNPFVWRSCKWHDFTLKRKLLNPPGDGQTVRFANRF
jgi:hypothetical protein